MVGASVDNTALAKGQQTVVSYACRSSSHNDVEDIYAELQEITTWSAQSHRETKTKTLHNVRFPIKDALKGMKKKDDKEMTQNDLDGYQYAGIVHEIHNRLNSATIVVPNNSNNTNCRYELKQKVVVRVIRKLLFQFLPVM